MKKASNYQMLTIDFVYVQYNIILLEYIITYIHSAR